MGEVGTGVPFTVRVSLEEDGARGILGGVGGDGFGILEFVDEVGDEWEWVGVPSGMFVQVTVILTRAETTIFLFNEKERGRLGGVQRTDLPAVKVFLEEVFGGFPFFWR